MRKIKATEVVKSVGHFSRSLQSAVMATKLAAVKRPMIVTRETPQPDATSWVCHQPAVKYYSFTRIDVTDYVKTLSGFVSAGALHSAALIT